MSPKITVGKNEGSRYQHLFDLDLRFFACFLVTSFSFTNTLLSSKFSHFLKCVLSMLPFWLNLQKGKSEIALLNNPDLAT